MWQVNILTFWSGLSERTRLAYGFGLCVGLWIGYSVVPDFFIGICGGRRKMGVVELFLIGVGLSRDAVAVSVC